MSTVETPPSGEPVPAQQGCPRCGARIRDAQEWCLNCGAAIGTRVVAAPGWRVPIALAAAILAIAAIAVVLAIVQLADDTDRVAEDPVAAQPTPAQTPLPTPSPTPESALTPDPTDQDDPALPEASGADPATTPDPGASGTGDAEWPAGKSGWTVVLASESSESRAREKAEGFADDGIGGVGVLDSDDFSSLRGGFWVVFAGQHDSQAEASRALDGIDRDAYIRRIEPD